MALNKPSCTEHHIEVPRNKTKEARLAESNERLRTALKDIRYIISQYRAYPSEALDAIEKIAKDKRLQ